jgi:hypothetical protein
MLGRLHLLLIQDGSKWQELPEWARFFVRLGFEVGRRPLDDRRLIVAVGVPTRFLAAAAASAGVVAGAVSGEGSSRSLREHFLGLSSAVEGTAVILERGGRQYSGEIQGRVEREGEVWLRVRIQDPKTGGETHLIRESESFRVNRAEESSSLLPEQPHGVAPVPRPAFLRSLLGSEGLHRISALTSLDCLIVGKAGWLKGELGGVKLGIQTSGRTVEEGRLDDLTRTRQVLGPRRTYRSSIVSSTSRLRPALSSARPRCVVFDGATGFLKWRHNWRGSHWVLVLDKTDPRCADAATAVNDEYEGRSLGVAADLLSLKRPPSVEVSAFYGPGQ